MNLYLAKAALYSFYDFSTSNSNDVNTSFDMAETLMSNHWRFILDGAKIDNALFDMAEIHDKLLALYTGWCKIDNARG
jgi:hypothetical protein